MRKIVSLVMRAPDALSRCPKLSKYAILPLRATTTTAPGSLPCSTSVLNTGPRRPSRAVERQTCSGGAVGSWAQTTVAEKTRTTVRTRLAIRLMARLLCLSVGPQSTRVGDGCGRGVRFERVCSRVAAPWTSGSVFARLLGPAWPGRRSEDGARFSVSLETKGDKT